MPTNLENLMKRYENLDTAMTQLNRDVERARLHIEVKKSDLQTRMAALQDKGLDFSNLTTLKDALSDLETTLETNLDSMERKLSEIQSK